MAPKVPVVTDVDLFGRLFGAQLGHERRHLVGGDYAHRLAGDFLINFTYGFRHSDPPFLIFWILGGWLIPNLGRF